MHDQGDSLIYRRQNTSRTKPAMIDARLAGHPKVISSVQMPYYPVSDLANCSHALKQKLYAHYAVENENGVRLREDSCEPSRCQTGRAVTACMDVCKFVWARVCMWDCLARRYCCIAHRSLSTLLKLMPKNRSKCPGSGLSFRPNW